LKGWLGRSAGQFKRVRSSRATSRRTFTDCEDMHGLRLVRRAVLVASVPVALFVALAAWSMSSPVGSSPDEDFHLASIWCGEGLRDDVCEAGLHPDERMVPQIVNAAPCYAFNDEKSASCVQSLASTMVNTNRGNFQSDYPPVFYATMGLFAGADVQKSVAAMRIFNSFLFVAIATALFVTLPTGKRGPLVWGSLVTLVPLGTFLIASINPSSWAVMAGALLWVAFHGYWTAPTLPRRVVFGALATLLAVMAAGARTDAAVYAILTIVLTAVLGAKCARTSMRLAVLPAALAIIAAGFFLASGNAEVVSPDASATDGSLKTIVLLAAINLVNLPMLWAGGLGTWGLGWLDTAMPSTVWFAMIGVFVAIVLWGLQRIGRRKTLALAMVGGSLIVVPLYVLVNQGIQVGVDVQPRYIYPLMIMFAGIAVLHFEREDLSLNRAQLAAIGGAVTTANAVALHTNVRRYVTGVDVRSVNLDAGREWWWNISMSPNAVWTMGTLAFAVGVTGVLRYMRTASTRHPVRADGLTESLGRRDLPSGPRRRSLLTR